MITTRRGRAKKRRAEEEEPDDDPTEALVRTTAALKDAHAAARKAEKQTLAKETEAASLKAERDALATRCAFLESESADAQRAVQSAQAEKTAAAAASQLELEKANQARRKAEAKQQADRGSLDAALCRVAALKRDLEIAEAKAQDIPEPPPAFRFCPTLSVKPPRKTGEERRTPCLKLLLRGPTSPKTGLLRRDSGPRLINLKGRPAARLLREKKCAPWRLKLKF